GGGESSSMQALKQLDSGTLTLTTKRLVFTGSMEPVRARESRNGRPRPNAAFAPPMLRAGLQDQPERMAGEVCSSADRHSRAGAKGRHCEQEIELARIRAGDHTPARPVPMLDERLSQRAAHGI